MADKRGNYIWFCYRHKKAVYVRRDNKTIYTYGGKNVLDVIKREEAKRVASGGANRGERSVREPSVPMTTARGARDQ